MVIAFGGGAGGKSPSHAHSMELCQGAQKDPELSKAEAPLSVDGAQGAAVLRPGHVLQDEVTADQPTILPLGVHLAFLKQQFPVLVLSLIHI